MTHQDYVALGKRIKEARKAIGLTQTKLAKDVGVSINFISQIELAKSKMSVGTLRKIAQALSTSVDGLLGNIAGERTKTQGVDTDVVFAMKHMTPAQRNFIAEHAKSFLDVCGGAV